MKNSFKRITASAKEKLIQQALERKARRIDNPLPHGTGYSSGNTPHSPHIYAQYCRFDLHPGYRQLCIVNEGAAQLGISNPYFRRHDGIAGSTTRIDGRELANFSSYNYLGLNGHPAVSAAAKEAIDRYGTSVSASRPVSGERPIHRDLEIALAELYESEDCVTFVSGHATNVTVIGCLFGARDLIVHDALAHNSALQGAQLSGARRLSFPHNDWQALESLLASQRSQFERVLVIIEGLYSMDGDFPELPRFLDIKRRYGALLMVDEAHALGVLGKTGRGIHEHFGVLGSDVDIWMGTLSKALAACGGYIAGSKALVEQLKYSAPGFLYSVGMSPPVAAAALAALRQMLMEPERVTRLQQNGRLFCEIAKAKGIDVGTCSGYAVVPAITGSSLRAAKLAQALYRRDINVQPIIYPAVQEKSARLRFFLSSEHTERVIRDTVAVLSEAWER